MSQFFLKLISWCLFGNFGLRSFWGKSNINPLTTSVAHIHFRPWRLFHLNLLFWHSQTHFILPSLSRIWQLPLTLGKSFNQNALSTLSLSLLALFLSCYFKDFCKSIFPSLKCQILLLKIYMLLNPLKPLTGPSDWTWVSFS